MENTETHVIRATDPPPGRRNKRRWFEKRCAHASNPLTCRPLREWRGRLNLAFVIPVQIFRSHIYIISFDVTYTLYMYGTIRSIAFQETRF